MELRDYQLRNVADAMRFISQPVGLHQRRLYFAPTGSGKGTTKLALLATLRRDGVRAWLLTPSVEIIRGFLERAGIDYTGGSEVVAKRAAELGITTGKRLCHKILNGDLQAPAVLLVDEVHEWVGSNTTPAAMFSMAPMAKWLGWTATPYRGTPSGSLELRRDWGEPVTVITLPECARRGYVTFPKFTIIPLCDDDKVKITNGEIDARGVSEAYQDRFGFLLETVEMAAGRPAMVCVSNTDMVRAVVEHATTPCIGITQATPGEERQRAVEACRRGEATLVQIRTLSRGFDMPELEVLIDAQPTLSPVLCVQTYGRVMRPRPGKVPEVWVTNRNLERHAHLFGDDLAPVREVQHSQVAFGGPCKRSIARVLGLEAFARFKMLSAPLYDGGYVQFYMLHRVLERSDGVALRHEEFAVILPPGSSEPVVASRVNRAGNNWGRWRVTDIPADLEGFTTSNSRFPLTEKQRNWWAKSAKGKGLDPDAADDLTSRRFQILPILFDIRKKL